jgi:hypothetical protein
MLCGSLAGDTRGTLLAGQTAIAARFVTALCLALTAAGCSSTVVESIPNWAGGEPEGTPQRLATELPTPPVNDRPPPRDTKIITVEEQAKIEKELAAAREVQAKQAVQIKKSRQDMLANQPKPPQPAQNPGN